MKHFLLFIQVFLITAFVSAQSLQELEQKYKENKASGNTNQVIFYLNKIAYKHWNNGQLNEATAKYNELLKLSEQQGNTAGVRNIHTNLGLVYSDLSQYDKALNSFRSALDIAQQQKSRPAMASAYVNIAVVHQSAGNDIKALENTEKALELARELNQMNLIKTCYGMLAETHKKLGNTEETMKYFNLYSSFDKHLKEQEMEKMKKETQEVVKQAQADKQKTETELNQEREKLKATADTLEQIEQLSKEQKQIIRLKDEKEKEMRAKLRSEEIIRYLLLGIAAIVFVFAFFIYRQVKQTKRANIALSQSNEEIKKQRDEIKKQSEKIRSSIQYAQRIQNAVLPPEDMFEKYLSEYFVLFKPRDIVSGDFYWMTEKDNKLIIAAADCTGHGVPGAFMSMLGVAFLNEIVNKIIENKHVKSLQASEILMYLKEYVINSLHQKGTAHESRDGMDIALVVIDKNTRELQFAGANNPLYLIREGELTIYSGDGMSISYNRDNTAEFTNHHIVTKPDDLVYIFSDGYPDQFGGDKGRKFMSKRFKRLLLEIHKESLDKQKHILDRTIMEWKKGHMQVDDMLVMGIKMDFKTSEKLARDQYDWSNKKVLIAEDTEANYLYLVEALRRTNVEIIRARNGKEAVEVVMEHNDIDLVLMDVNMPVMDGFEATQNIKEKKRKLPVVAQTALNISDVENKAKKVGVDDIIYKPIKLKLFLKIIGKFLG